MTTGWSGGSRCRASWGRTLPTDQVDHEAREKTRWYVLKWPWSSGRAVVKIRVTVRRPVVRMAPTVSSRKRGPVAWVKGTVKASKSGSAAAGSGNINKAPLWFLGCAYLQDIGRGLFCAWSQLLAADLKNGKSRA